jgi:uncharacterized protein YutE (UPF0331/DUF86 family)
LELNLDHDRIRQKLEDIDGALARLKRLGTADREQFLLDEDSQDIARSRLLTAIEAALNICYHISAKRLQKIPEDYAECFLHLGRGNLIDSSLSERLAAMARFRNRLVHLYWDIDYGAVYNIIHGSLQDLEEFSAQIGSLL